MRCGTLDRQVLLPASAACSGEGHQDQVPNPKTQKSRKVTIMNEAQMTLVGNLRRGPRAAVHPRRPARGQVPRGQHPRYFDKAANEWKDGDSLFLTCTVWRQAAENVAESLLRGTRVIVTGRLKQRSYETKEGEKRTVYELEVDEVGPCLRNASAKVTRSPAPAPVTAARPGRGCGQQAGRPVGQRRPPASTFSDRRRLFG